jgi:hypothetical protein
MEGVRTEGAASELTSKTLEQLRGQQQLTPDAVHLAAIAIERNTLALHGGVTMAVLEPFLLPGDAEGLIAEPPATAAPYASVIFSLHGLENGEWTLLIVDKERCQLFWYDPLQSSERAVKSYERLLRWSE